MEYRRLEPNGVWVALLCLGMQNFGDPTPKETAHMRRVAFDPGLNLYIPGESERSIGRAFHSGAFGEPTLPVWRWLTCTITVAG